MRQLLCSANCAARILFLKRAPHSLRTPTDIQTPTFTRTYAQIHALHTHTHTASVTLFASAKYDPQKWSVYLWSISLPACVNVCACVSNEIISSNAALSRSLFLSLSLSLSHTRTHIRTHTRTHAQVQEGTIVRMLFDDGEWYKV